MSETRLKFTYDDLDKLPHNKICELIAEGLIDRPFYMGYLEHQKTKSFSALRQKDKDDGKEYNYPTFEFGMAAYTYALENPVDHKQALDFASNLLGKDDEWLNEVRHKRFNHSKDVYNEHKEHPVQKELSKQDYFDPSNVKNSTSVTQMTKRILMYKDTYHVIEAMSDDIDYLKSENESFKAQVDLLNRKAGLSSSLTDKEYAIELKRNGWSNTAIAKELDVHRNTVANWLKEV